jgi:hypothetical protein
MILIFYLEGTPQATRHLDYIQFQFRLVHHLQLLIVFVICNSNNQILPKGFKSEMPKMPV